MKSFGTKYGKLFKTKKGTHGRYKYVNGRRVAFVPSGKQNRRRSRNSGKWY